MTFWIIYLMRLTRHGGFRVHPERPLFFGVNSLGA